MAEKKAEEEGIDLRRSLRDEAACNGVEATGWLAASAFAVSLGGILIVL